MIGEKERRERWWFSRLGAAVFEGVQSLVPAVWEHHLRESKPW